MWQAAVKFIRDEEGATAVEYGLIAALIAVAIMITLQAIGVRLNVIFTSILTALGGGG